MSESKTYVFTPEGAGTGSSGILGMLAPLLQKNGLDPNLLALMNGKNNNGAFGGEGGWFIWVIFLFFLMGWGGNGNGFGFGNRGGAAGGVENQINNDYGRDLLMQAINGNRTALSELATNLNCSIGQVQQAISSVSTQVQSVGNQVGMSSMQVINAIQAGNTTIAQQIASCCCENRLAICQQTNTLQSTINQNSLSLRDANTANTNSILNRLDAMQNQTLLDKIDALREKNSTLTSQINNEHQTVAIQSYQAQTIAPVNAALADLSSRLAKIECKQPETVNIPYIPAMGSFIPVNYGLNVTAAAAASTCGC